MRASVIVFVGERLNLPASSILSIFEAQQTLTRHQQLRVQLLSLLCVKVQSMVTLRYL